MLPVDRSSIKMLEEAAVELIVVPEDLVVPPLQVPKAIAMFSDSLHSQPLPEGTVRELLP